MSSRIIFGRTQLAEQTPFDNATNGFTSTDVQAAIEETKTFVLGAAVSPIVMGAIGASSNKYLEFFRSIPTNDTPFVAPFNMKIIALSGANKLAGKTATIEVYIDGVLADTLEWVNQQNAIESSLNIDVLTNETISAKLTAGSLTDPILTIFLQGAP
jgi:hypothetical protein